MSPLSSNSPTTSLNQVKIFSGSESLDLTKAVCARLNLPISRNQLIKFSEGNIFVELQENVQNQHVFIIQSIASNINESFMELLFWIDALKRNGARKISVVIPYFSYAKSDKPDGVGTSIRGRVCADCLEMVGMDDLIVMDLHSPQIQGFFRQPVYHLSALSVFTDYLQETFQPHPDTAVVVSPDAGFEKSARYYADALDLNLAIGEKVRPDHTEKPLVKHIGGASVQGKTCFVVDDFTISGGTLIEITQKLREQGAREIIACVSHALLSPEGVAKINQSPLDQLVITDTVSNTNLGDSPKIKVVTAAPIFAQAMANIA